MIRRCVLLLSIYAPSIAAGQHDPNPRLDRSRPVPTKAEVIGAWQSRQDAVRTFQFAWTESQVHPTGWVPNPRYPEREWLSIAGLLRDRHYRVTKTLAVSGNMMRYTTPISADQFR